MAGREPDTGPTATTVAANVKRLRDEVQNLTYTELSERLRQRADWSISPVGIRRLEAGERRITADDLVALAVALGVSPATLLMPPVGDAAETVTATGTGERAASRLWNWLVADNPLKGSGRQLTEFWLMSWPEWEHDRMGQEIQTRKRQFDAEITRRRERATKRKADSGDD